MATMKPSLTLVGHRAPEPEDAGPEEFKMHGAEDLHDRLRAMRLMLESAPHATASEALAMLRQAFPDAVLSDRVRAIDYREEN